MQHHLEQLIKDLVSSLLDINIAVRSDATERRLFNFAVLVIDYYWPRWPCRSIESIFSWLHRLSLLGCPLTNPYYIKNESHSDNCNIGRVDNEEEMPPIDPDHTESESYGDHCSINHYNTSDGMGVQELLSDNSKSSIDNCDISRVDIEMTLIEMMLPTNFNCTESERYNDNCNNNCNDDSVGGEEWK